GIDGAGKSTHINSLAQAFRAQGHVVTLTREPGGTPLAEQLRQMVLNDPMDAMTEALLVFAARRDHLQKVILPALARGEVLLCDRFTDATFAYQGAGRGFDWQTLLVLEEWVQGRAAQGEAVGSDYPLQPNLTIWFDLPASVAAQRLSNARVPDRFESQPLVFFEQVASGYAKRMAADPSRFARIDADQAPHAVGRDVLQSVRAKGLLS
ncbi:MAG: dTMP kinase, partial [Candidatus Saccharibacteria bacterium]|nr:dTMP kinase [Rhodoferax sp.]